ncbi:hypothetical protein D9M68_347490 [compost metagenome]
MGCWCMGRVVHVLQEELPVILLPDPLDTTRNYHMPFWCSVSEIVERADCASEECLKIRTVLAQAGEYETTMRVDPGDLWHRGFFAFRIEARAIVPASMRNTHQ